MNNERRICLYMNDGVLIGTTKSILEAYYMLQDCKAQDKMIGCSKYMDYYFELEEETETEIYTYPVKIYKRKNKYFMKGI